ncbi:MAG: NAD(P)H-hydrate dehydratase [Paracoccaceae bacterium]
MSELLTAAQMRAIEKAAIDSGQVTGLELMERAGQGVVEAIFEEWPELAESAEGGAAPRPSDAPRRVSNEKKLAVVLCGPGNNGGDGFVVARLLKERGWEVELFLYGDPEKLPPDARVNYERWLVSGDVAKAEQLVGWKGPCYDIVVDAMFGTGLTRPLSREAVEIHKFISAHPNGKVVSVDTISGLDMDSGRSLAEQGAPHFTHSDLTVCFHRQKLGHRIGDHVADYGEIRVIDIGLNQGGMVGEPVELLSLEQEDHSKEKLWIAAPNKYSYGHALILSGGSGKTGAARLAARGALRIGAGLVTLGVPPSAQMEVASQITSLMLRRVEGGDGLAELLSDERLNALCLGPGFGLDRARDLVPVALASKRAVVLDADALSAFADAPEDLFGMLHDTCVLTPHGGEFARLFPDISEKLNAVPTKGPAYSKVDATREAAKRAGCVVLFKGPDTVIAAPDGRCSVNSAHYERAAPWLATAGSGDVLAGFITGLLARGFDPMQAAETAAWLHVECARHFGPGLIAEDLPEQLPAVFRVLGL